MEVSQVSGRNQHHFWQVLQRGFGTERKTDFTTVFVYQKEKIPFPVGTRNFGGERDFFDFKPGSGADALITKTEGELQGLVKYFQTGGPVTDEKIETIASLIAHLEIRTKFIRQHPAEIVSETLAELSSWFSSPEVLKSMTRKYAANNPKEIDAILLPHIGDPETRAAAVKFFIENSGQLDVALFAPGSDEARQSSNTVSGNMTDIAKEAHIRAILNAPSESARRSRYLDLRYQLKSGFGGNLICPDTMVAFLTDHTTKPFLDKGDRLEAVWIPLNADLLLIGETSTPMERSIQSTLRILASTSYSAFIAKSDSPDLRRLTSRVGKNASMLRPAAISSIMRNLLADLI